MRKRKFAKNTRQTQKRKLTLIYACGSLAIAAIFCFIFFVYSNFHSGTVMAASSGDYRSKATGNWSSTSTWERYNGSSWVSAPAAPTSSDGVITIQNGHTVTIASSVTVDQVVINSGGTVVLNSGITLTVADASGTDFNVSGIFKNAGTVTINLSATVKFQSGGKYQHNFTTTAGTIPTATWNSGSTCEIIGYTGNNAAPGGLQSFSNFTWNCPSQSSDISLNGGLTIVNGNFTVTSTGTKELRLAANGSTISIGGNYIQSGGKFVLSTASSVTSIINLTGDYSQSGGTFSLVTGSGSTGRINASGNWQHTGGTLTVGGNGSTNGQVHFSKSGTQTFNASGNTVSGNVDFTVNSGSTLTMGTNVLTGRNFTLSSGAGIILGSASGITSSGSSGNIQVSGTRSFNTGANYTYNGSVAQNTGNGLPSTINNLTLNSSNDLSLSATTTVSNVLTLTSGRIVSGPLIELKVTNTSTSAIQSHSSSGYVIGNLRRSVNGSGTYDFPLGTSSNYELISVTLSSTAGFSNILGTFTNSDPVTVSLPLVGIVLNGLSIDNMLDYGYWTLTPNLLMLSGTYSVTVKHQGSNTAPEGRKYCVLKRNSILTSWQSVGTHNNSSQTVSGGVVTGVRSGLTSFSDFGVGYSEYYSFNDPSLISGTTGQVNAVYKFENIKEGLDAWVEIQSLDNGAELADIDQFNGGYNEAWQPLVESEPNDTAIITWKMTFKVGGTSTDTIIPNLSITAVDVDGGDEIKEFIDAPQIYSYATDVSCNLQINNNQGYYRAMGAFVTVDNIDTSERQAMFQINYVNVNNFVYRTGSVSIASSSEERQYSLYFNPFFSGNQALPVKLVYFNAKSNGINRVDLSWTTATETNNDYFTIESSGDGKHFTSLAKINGAGKSTSEKKYKYTDNNPLKGVSYYRLRQTDYNGKYEIFKMVSVKVGNNEIQKTEEAKLCEIKKAYPNPFHDQISLKIQSVGTTSVELQLMQTNGTIIKHEKAEFAVGESDYSFTNLGTLSPGVYFIQLLSNGKPQQSIKIIKK